MYPEDTATESELEALFRLSLDMLCIAGLDGYFKRVNPAFEKILGHGISELLDRPFIDFVHPDDRDATIRAMGALAQGGTVCQFENRYRCRDGSYRWLSWTSAPGGEDRVYAVATDVTIRKEAEEALRNSQRRYRQLLQAVTTYTYTVEVRNGLAVSSTHSEGVLSVTGFTADELARDPYLWFRMIHPDDRQRVQSHVASILADEPVAPFEHRIVHHEGGVRWLRDTIIPHHDSSGTLVRYDGVVQDITDQKEVEERFRTLVECAPDAIVVADARGRIVHVNRKTETLFGYARADLLGEAVELLIPERFRRKHVIHRLEFATTRSSRAMGDRPDLACRRKDGREFPAEISLSAIGDGEQTLIYSSIRDVTELRAAQARNLENEVQQMASHRIQQRLLPDGPPTFPGFDIAGEFHPAALTGGDLFDFIPMSDGTLGLAIGDVTGHGIAAALVMASAHAYLRLLATTTSDVSRILARANVIIAQETEDTRFVTLLLGRLDPHGRTFTYASAGHPTGYLLDYSGAIKAQVASTSYPLGVVGDAAFPSVGPILLSPGDLLLLLTDGVLEALSPDGRSFGIDRMLETVRAHRHHSSRQIIDVLYRAVLEFTHRNAPDDDMTIIVVKDNQPLQ